MNLGFTGTRNGMSDAQAAVFEGMLTDVSVFRHGSCQGADVEAARIIRKVYGQKVKIIALPGPDDDHYRQDSGVDDEVLPGRTHFARNRAIVAGSDMMIATPAANTWQERGGTFYTANYSIKVGKPLIVIWPDGSIESR